MPHMPNPEKALRWTALVAVFALPFIVFIVSRTLFFPFITGKNFAFRFLVEIAFSAWLALAIINPAYRPKRSWLLWAFAAFVAIVALADAFGVYPFKSFWSNYERMDGWVTLAHLFAYFVAASSLLNTEHLWKRLWQTSLGVSVAAGFYGLMQIAGIAALNPGFSSATRIDATFGNPIYLAAYMLFHVFIAALLFVLERRKDARWTPILYYYAGAMAFNTLILFLTGTRGAMLGLIGGSVIALALYTFSSASRTAWRRLGITVLALVFAAGALYVGRDTAFVQNVGFLNRLATISLEDNTTKARFLNWGMAWEGVKERPLLGWGQENYAIVFDKYYDPEMYAQEPWFDRVHNIIFDWLVAAGVLGLLGYLSLFATALYLVWKRATFLLKERAILTGLLAGYFFHNLFVFDNITSYVLFGTTLSYIAWRAFADEPRSAVAPLSGAKAVIVAGVVALGGLVLMWFINAPGFAQNRTLLKAVSNQPNPTQNLDFFRQSIAYGSFGTQEAREQLVQAAAGLLSNANVPTDLKQAFYEAALSEIKKQEEASPLDARFPLFRGILLRAAGNNEEALAALTHALSLSEKKQTIMYEIANTELALGQNSAALATLRKAWDLVPENDVARSYYAAAAIRTNNFALADEVLAPVIAAGRIPDQRVIAAYVATGRYDKLVIMFEAAKAANPEDVQLYFSLAAAYFGAGNSAKAIQTLEEVKKVDPTAAGEADALIEEIRSGRATLQ